MITQHTSEQEYSDKQIEILARASVSRPKDLPTPTHKLEFANAETRTKPENPVDQFRLRLDVRRLEEERMLPVRRMQLQDILDSVSQARFERATETSTISMADSAYVAAMRAVLPFVDVDSATIINRMLPHYAK